MKFIIENNCKVCRELQPSTIAEIYDKMCFIEDHVEEIVNFLFKQYPMDKLSQEYKNSAYRLEELISEIILDTDVDTDEFNLRVGKDKEYITIELLTKEIAEDNDKDFVNENNGYSKEELATYELGGSLSIYTKLSDKYYFRFI